VKAEGTVGRPPAEPRAIAVCLLIRAIFGLSYRSTYSFLASSRDYREACGIARLPGYNTAQEHCRDVPEKYLDGLVRLTAALILLAQHRMRCDSGCDSTGLATRKYGRWLEVRNSRRKKKKRRFVKLHAHTTTDAEMMPFFLTAKVTKGYKSDSKQFGDLLRKTGGVEIGEVTLDKGYLSRLNAQLIADIGAHPYIALKENIISSALSHGYPAWNNMVHEAWEHKEEYEKHYHRRSVVEGLFNAFKERFGREVASKIRHNQNVEVLCRVMAWNVLALAYHSNP